MLRLAEIGLLLGPLAVVLVWWRLARSGGPSRSVLGLAACGLLATLGALIWLSQQDRMGRNEAYVPARAVDGRIVPGHAATR